MNKKPAKGSKRGPSLYVEVLSLCRRQPRTPQELCDRFGWYHGHSARMRQLLVHMVRADMLHVCEWRRSGGRGVYVPAFAFGVGASVASPTGMTIATRGRSSVAMFATFKAVWDCLREPSTRSDIEAASGLSRVATFKVLDQIRRKRLARICQWDRRIGVGGSPIPLYQLGNGNDAARPAPLTDAQKRRRGSGRIVTDTALRMLGRPINDERAEAA